MERSRSGRIGALLLFVLACARVSRADGVPHGEPPPAAAPAPAAAELEAWLGRLTGSDAAARQAAESAIESASASMVPAIAQHLALLKRSANRDGMAATLAKARRTGDDERSTKAHPSESPRESKSFDWFERVMAAPAPGDEAWRDLASILGMSRMLVHIATLPAVRELAAIYPGFNELLRVDVERQMKGLGEHAVATLIELRRGDAKNLRPWAAKLLDILGKTVPGEAVQTADNQILADVLRAYGRTKDLDAARVIVSFANSDRAQVREAAREAVSLLAENSLWQLRESYENLTGKKPPEDWAWEKVASELFASYDRSRLSEVYGLMDEGLAAQKSAKLEAMASAFDRVLARAPLFARRAEMVPGYLELARALVSTDRPRALATLRKVVRLDPVGPRANEAESELAYLEAEDLASRGVVDEAAYRRAIDIDPNNSEARDAFRRVVSTSDSARSSYLRLALAAALALAALLGTAFALIWRRTPASTLNANPRR